MITPKPLRLLISILIGIGLLLGVLCLASAARPSLADQNIATAQETVDLPKSGGATDTPIAIITSQENDTRSAVARSAAAAAPWTVFYMPNLSPNLLINPGFEDGSPVAATGWYSFPIDSHIYTYTVDPIGGFDGGRALELINTVTTDTYHGGARQIITLNQVEPRPLYVSARSKAECVSGDPGGNYSVYLDIQYTDDTWLYGQVLSFDRGACGWQFRDAFILPTKLIQTVNVHCLLRYDHEGTVWFDDLNVQEVQTRTVIFDSIPVTTSQPSSPPYGGEGLSLTTDDGLALTMAAEGGAITSMMLGTTEVQDPAHANASGFFVHDVLSQSDYIHVGGHLTPSGEAIIHTSTIVTLGLDFSASYAATADRIMVHAQVTDTTGSERALTLYFALPISATEEWIWGNDIRASLAISGQDEIANFSEEYGGIGATGRLSRYPWASLSGPPGGIALGIPLDSPRATRLIHNPVTNQFYVAFDLGLSPHTTSFPAEPG